MSDPNIVQALREIELFRGIDDPHLERLAALARYVEFPANVNIFKEHDSAKDVYVLISGQVSLVICEPTVGCRQLTQVSDGDLIGWAPLVGNARLSDTAHTLTPTKLLAINGEQALELCRQDPKFGFEFMHRVAITMAQRLGATRLQLLNLSGLQLPDVQIESD
jgi:CRP-like cAMP-binding protein